MGKELCLWEKLKLDGFQPKEYKSKLTTIQKIKNLFGANILPKITISNDHLTKQINGKQVEVAMIDFWYTRATVDGEVIFDARRFDDQELFSAIEIAIN
jgi:hypothetical protein